MGKKIQRFCALAGCGVQVDKKGAYCSPEHKHQATAPWVVRGGVGNSMYCAEAAGIWPYCWKIRVEHSRHFKYREHAERVARLVNGTAEQVPA